METAELVRGAGSELVRLLAGKPGLDELLERSRSRGYVLLSEIHQLHDPIDDAATWVEDVAQAARDQHLQVVDDLTDDADPPPANPLSASTDSVRQYLNGIGAVDLLTAEEEVDLAKRDQAGRVAKLWLEERDDLTRGQRLKLRRMVVDGQRSQEHMVCANLRLVVSVARRYLGRGLSLLELIQEGNLGLIRGVEKFDHTKGYKFSTYATWWIRQALTRGTANKSRTVRLPVHVHEMVSKIRRAELDHIQVTGEEPSEQEVADTVGIDVARLREIKLAGRDMASLDRPVGEDGDISMGDLVADQDAIDPEIAAAFALTRLELSDALMTLHERERGVLMMRFGLLDGECHTLEEIGDRYGVTRERIRQIEKKTLAKLRHPSRANRLKGLVETAEQGAHLANG